MMTSPKILAGLTLLGLAMTASCAESSKPAEPAKPAKPAAEAEKPADSAKPYKVQDGNKVDPNTMKGWRTWRALACERCHGPNQEGMVGPSLLDSLKVLNKDEFKKTVLEGRPEKGMPNFNASAQVVENIDNLYAFLKGRSDGAIKSGRLEELK